MKNVLKKSAVPIISLITLILSYSLFSEQYYTAVSFIIAGVSIIGFGAYFERRDTTSRYAVLVAVMTALSVVGRMIFAPIPAFKPVSAIVIISGMYLSAGGGFLTGALTALISNMTFGHGAWTPYQMLAWGIIGLAAGIISEPLKKNKLLLILYGAFAGVFYSFFMDIWTVLWIGEGFSIELYQAKLITAIPYTVTYAVSNMIFLFIMAKPFGRKLGRAVTLIER